MSFFIVAYQTISYLITAYQKTSLNAHHRARDDPRPNLRSEGIEDRDFFEDGVRLLRRWGFFDLSALGTRCQISCTPSSNNFLSYLHRRRLFFHLRPVESQTRTYHGRAGSGRRAAGRQGGTGLGRTGRRRIDSPRRQPLPGTLQGIVESCLECLFRSTNKRNPMKTDGGTKTADDQRFIRGTKGALRSRLLGSRPSLFFYETVFPDMPCMERVYRDNGFDPLVSRPERRAAVVPRINS